MRRLANPVSASRSLPRGETALSRYATFLNTTEINSSFYRSHQTRTFRDDMRSREQAPTRVFAQRPPPRAVQVQYGTGGCTARLGPTSAYSPDFLVDLASKLRLKNEHSQDNWVALDNTATGHAVENAAQLKVAVS